MSISKAEKERIEAERIEDRKCSGPKSCHGMRSSVARTWDSSKGGRSTLKTVKPKDIPEDRLDSLAEKIASTQGWGYEFVRSRPPAQIVGMARKYLR